MEKSPPNLPLSFVDWHSEQAKFESGPYCTTILGLDWIVEKVLGSKPIKDYANYDAVERQLRALSSSLGIDLASSSSETFKRFSKNVKQAVEPFSYLGSWTHEAGGAAKELGAIVEAFQRVWARPLVRLLTEFSPYANLLQMRGDLETLSPEFVNWYYLRGRAEQAPQALDELRKYEALLRRRKVNPVNEAELQDRLQQLEDLKGDSLAFKVAFQRALVWAFVDFYRIDDADLPSDNGFQGDDQEGEELEEATPASLQATTGVRAKKCDERSKQFIAALNRVLDEAPQFLDVRGETKPEEHYIWHGSLYNLGGNTVDFTGAASDRARDLIFAAAILVVCSESKEAGADLDFEELWDHLEDSELGIHKRLLDCMRRKAAGEKGFGGRIAKERNRVYDEELALLEEVKERLRWLWELLAPAKKTPKKKKNKG